MTRGYVAKPRMLIRTAYYPVVEQVKTHAEGRRLNNSAFSRIDHKRYPFDSGRSRSLAGNNRPRLASEVGS